MRRIQSLLFLIVAFVAIEGSGRGLLAARPPHICEEYCTTSTSCEEACYVDLMEYENGNAITCLEYGVYDEDAECCGDGICDLTVNESCGSCEDDCGACISAPACGQNGCEQGENCENCPDDCGSCNYSSSCNDNGKCDRGEPKDCTDCMATGYCAQDSDCPDFDGYTYLCVTDQCVLQDLPSVTTTCNLPTDCDSGWKCIDIPDWYHGSTYYCGGCKVCVPRWVN